MVVCDLDGRSSLNLTTETRRCQVGIAFVATKNRCDVQLHFLLWKNV